MEFTPLEAWSVDLSVNRSLRILAKVDSSNIQAFHNDMGADIVALQVRQCAKEGGDTYVASAGKIVCELVARRPDIIETLTRADWPIQVFVPSIPLRLRLP